VIGKDGLAGGDQFAEAIAAGALGQVGFERLAGDVMRRRQLHVELAGADHQMSIAHAEVEPHSEIREALIERVDQRAGLVGGDVAGAVVDHGAARQGDQVAAEDGLVVGDGDALGGRFQRRSAGVAFSDVVADHRQNGHVAAGRVALRDVADQPELTGRGERIDHGLVSGLEGGLAAQSVQGSVGGAVGDDNGVLHGGDAWA
jgi:hypothetical protein